MKKLSCIFLSMVMITTLMAPSVFGASPYPYYKKITLTPESKSGTLNNEQVQLADPPRIVDGRTLVPFRFLGESLGATISWDDNTRTANLSSNGNKVAVTLGSKVAYVNGKTSELDVPAQSINGRTYVPLRFIGESLGAVVDYNTNTQLITIQFADKAQWKNFVSKHDVKYLYPGDWTIREPQDREEPVFVSPKGSEVYTTYFTTEPAQLYTQIKSDREKDGWTLVADMPTNQGDYNKGFQLLFTKTDANNNTHYCAYDADPMNTGSWLGEIGGLQSEYNNDIFIGLEIAMN